MTSSRTLGWWSSRRSAASTSASPSPCWPRSSTCPPRRQRGGSSTSSGRRWWFAHNSDISKAHWNNTYDLHQRRITIMLTTCMHVKDALSRWEYIVGYLPDIWKFGLFSTFNAAKIVLISYLDNIFGLQSHTKSLQSKKSIFTLMGSHIDNSENSIFMSFNDKKIIY